MCNKDVNIINTRQMLLTLNEAQYFVHQNYLLKNIDVIINIKKIKQF